MRVARLVVGNFRGIKSGELFFPEHAVLVGDNNSGKSTVLEAIDLVLGPERLSKRPVIDEHDFYAGEYLDGEGNPITISIEVVVAGLNPEQSLHFKDHIEWWNEKDQKLLDGPPPEGTDAPGVVPALRVLFQGNYDSEEDDFTGKTLFANPKKLTLDTFRSSDKRICGFLYLRTLRTGTRALSLERGSLLDIIIKLQDKHLTMWEEVLEALRNLPVAEKPEIGLAEILSSVQGALKKFVPADWASSPHLRVSDLTRESLRGTLTVFMSTGAKRAKDGKEYAAPFQHQGTGTINTLVLAMLSLIAELKQNVIFAMEEPEIAIPPHAQKRIIESVRVKSAQAIFTSHSPYVLEEFPPEQMLLLKREAGVLTSVPASLPPSVKPKKYKEEFRKRFCEALLARRVLITEGRTEYDAFPVAAQRLHEASSNDFHSLEAMGIATISAETDSQIAPLGEHFRKLSKTVFAVFDKQGAPQKATITGSVDHAFEAPEKTFEETLLSGTAEAALRKFALGLVADGEWPTHLAAQTPSATTPLPALRSALKEYLSWGKGSGTAAELLRVCDKNEMPAYVVATMLQICKLCMPPKGTPPATVGAASASSDG